MPVTAVGDPAQGIYGWRGAATGNLEEFLNDFGDDCPGQRLTLRETRRCAPEIIDAANEIASEFHKDSSVKPLTSANPPGGLVEVALHSTVSDEIGAMVAKIAAIRDAGQIPLRKVAILVRVAKENGEIVKALRDAHIPFEIVGLQGLLVQPEVLDVVVAAGGRRRRHGQPGRAAPRHRCPVEHRPARPCVARATCVGAGMAPARR